MSDNEEQFELINKQPNIQGDKLVKEAKKRLQSISLFNPNKYEEAIELFEKAAAQYKSTKNWNEAGEVYVICAEICEKRNNQSDACNYYTSAGKMYRHYDISNAVKMFLISGQMHQEDNRFSAAAKLYKDIGNCYERLLNTKDAIIIYSKAADLYEAEDATSNANQCRQKVSELYVENGEYQKALELYEKISKSSLESNVGKWTAKDYFYKALMCKFVLLARSNQVELLQEKIENYKDLLPSLDGSRECKFIEDILQSYIDDDIEKFSDIVFKYNEIYKIDDFTTKMLYEIKQLLRNNEEEQDLT